MANEIVFPEGIRLLSRWQQNDMDARESLRGLFDAAIGGQFDENFAMPTPQDAVHVGGPVNLMTLNIMNNLYGMESAEFYKTDTDRYVRTTLDLFHNNRPISCDSKKRLKTAQRGIKNATEAILTKFVLLDVWLKNFLNACQTTFCELRFLRLLL